MTDDETTTDLTIETRFGVFTFADAQTLEMPSGMVGFPEHKAYGLATPPQDGYENFVILQCLSAPDLGFVTAPAPKQDGPFEDDDLREAVAAYGVDW
ncbi:MAG: flagellar assembly protein FliW, partial [Pseudomonadota bacterium]